MTSCPWQTSSSVSHETTRYHSLRNPGGGTLVKRGNLGYSHGAGKAVYETNGPSLDRLRRTLDGNRAAKPNCHRSIVWPWDQSKLTPIVNQKCVVPLYQERGVLRSFKQCPNHRRPCCQGTPCLAALEGVRSKIVISHRSFACDPTISSARQPAGQPARKTRQLCSEEQPGFGTAKAVTASRAATVHASTPLTPSQELTAST